MNHAIKAEENIMDALTLPNIKVLGLGGGGSNAVDRMMQQGWQNVEFIAANTDAQALAKSLAPVKIHLGPKLTRGLGAGGNPSIGQKAAEESAREIYQALQGADMVFLTAGMGGGTGTGAISVAAQISRKMDAVTIAVVTTPFNFEQGLRIDNAMAGLKQLRPHTHTLITIPNDRLLQNDEIAHTKFENALYAADDILRQGVQSVSELITSPGLINVDFAHINRMMRQGGGAMLSIGLGEGENRVEAAVQQALNHPLLEDISLENAGGIIANFSFSDELNLQEYAQATHYLYAHANSQTELIFGVSKDHRLPADHVQVILVITGMTPPTLEEAMKIAIPHTIQHSETQFSQQKNCAASGESEVPLPAPSGLDVPAFLRRRASLTQVEKS